MAAEVAAVAEEATEEEPEQAAAEGNCTLTLQRLSAIRSSLFNLQDVVSLVGLRITQLLSNLESLWKSCSVCLHKFPQYQENPRCWSEGEHDVLMQQEMLVMKAWSEQIHWTPRLHWVGRLLAHGFYSIGQQGRCIQVTGGLAAQLGKLSRVARAP